MSAPYVEPRKIFALVSVAAALVLAGCAGTPAQPRRSAAAGDEVTPGVSEEALTAHALALDAMRRGETAAAEIALERLIASYGHLPGPLVNAAILHRQNGRADDAFAALERALAIDPVHPEANNELGILLRERGEFDAAEAAYRRALAGRPDYPLALYNLGVLLDLYLKRPSEALECYEAYQGLLPEPDPRVALWIVDLRRRVGADESTRLARESGG